MDVWYQIYFRYALRVVGMHSEVYKMSARDPAYLRMIMLTLQRRNELEAANELTEALYQVESHNMTGLIKAVSTLIARNNTKRSMNQGIYADLN